MSEVDLALAHFGVKGMKWGIRKDSLSSNPGSLSNKGVTIAKDGSISIVKGANLQRLVRSNGNSMPLKDITYASINPYDNARYIKVIGGRGPFGGGRDQILTIQATKPIKAPSYEASVKMVSSLYLNDPKFRETTTDPFIGKINDKELAEIKANPTGKTAKSWYFTANQSLTFGEDFSPGITYSKNTIKKKLEENGYNAIRDENDFDAKLAKAPVIIFSPEKNLKVTKVSDITNELRKSNKEQLKMYKSMGKEWIENEIYA